VRPWPYFPLAPSSVGRSWLMPRCGSGRYRVRFQLPEPQNVGLPDERECLARCPPLPTSCFSPVGFLVRGVAATSGTIQHVAGSCNPEPCVVGPSTGHAQADGSGGRAVGAEPGAGRAMSDSIPPLWSHGGGKPRSHSLCGTKRGTNRPSICAACGVRAGCPPPGQRLPCTPTRGALAFSAARSLQGKWASP
jgi:hypothetical protein